MRHAAHDTHGTERAWLASALSPAALSRGMLQATLGAALIALCSGALMHAPRPCSAGPLAVALAAIAAAAQHHLRAAARAHEQAGCKLGQACSSGHTRPEDASSRATASKPLRWTRSPGDATLTPRPLLQRGVGPAVGRSRHANSRRRARLCQALRAVVLPPAAALSPPPDVAACDPGLSGRPRASEAALQGGLAGAHLTSPTHRTKPGSQRWTEENRRLVVE